MKMTAAAWEKLNLAEQFAHLAAYSKQQSKAGAYDQPVYTGKEDSKLTKHFEIELIKIQEGGVR